MSTHEVFNQAPARVDLDAYAANAALVEGAGAVGGVGCCPRGACPRVW